MPNYRMKQFYFLLLLFTSVCFAQISPPVDLQSYYNGVDFSKNGLDLFDYLAVKTIEKHSPFLTYTERHNYLYDADEDPSNVSNVILVYSGESRNENEYESTSNPYNPQTFNTEHIYPRSLLDNSNAEADLHILRTCDISINSSRGNDPFAAGSGSFSSTGSAWYPGDDWRGDVARIIMYVNLRYNEPFTDVGTLSLFLQWNAFDQVSVIEDQRNAIISGAQGNRNPFIDNPYLATLIWGGNAAENRWSTLSNSKFSSLDYKIFPNPVSGNYLNVKANQVLKVGVYDVLGKLIMSSKVDSNNSKIDVSQLKKGLYLIKLESDKGTITKKLIKQ